MSYLFRDQSWPMMQEHIDKKSLLILPVGTTEEHGPHLPVDTDARIAEAYGHGLAQALEGELPVLLMDTIRYGYSMKIMRQWPGTIIVRSRVFMDMIFDICRSALDMGFDKLAILDCHGHHGGALNMVSRELCDATDKAVAVISPATLSREAYAKVRQTPPGGSIHACEWETSLVLHLNPEVVDMSKATDEDMMRYHSEFVAGDGFTGGQKVTWSTWYLQASKSGISGAPLAATAEMGRVIMDGAVTTGARFLKEYWNMRDVPVVNGEYIFE
jgi:creatinine amidohydrolase